jgi:hypothetical protein
MFFQFEYAGVRDLAADEVGDRHHISPVHYLQLRYMFAAHGASPVRVLRDKTKRAALMPLYLILLPFGWLWARWLLLHPKDAANRPRNRQVLREIFAGPILFSRSLVAVFERRR